MAVARGQRGRCRFLAVKTRRMEVYLKALDGLLRGETSPEYVAIRARKYSAMVRHCR